MLKRATNLFLNVMTMVILVLTFIWCLVFFAIVGDVMRAPIFPPMTKLPATVATFDSPTPRPTITPSHTPTFTPSHTPTFTPTHTDTATATTTGTPTTTFTPSMTFTASATPTNTLVPPTNTPTKTPTPTASATFTPTITPTGPPPTPTSQFAFMVQPSSIILRENFANEAGCNWQGIGGQITTPQNEPLLGVEVRVSGPLIGTVGVLSGTNSFYGPAGWEVVVGDAPNNFPYQVSLWANGVQVSPIVEITFPNSCQANLATVNFIRTRPY